MSKNKPLIILSHPLPEAWIQLLTDKVDIVIGLTGADDRLNRAEGLLTLLTQKVDAALLDRMPNLKVVSQMAVGVDNIDLAACSERQISVGHTPGVLTDATADLAMALLLAAARRLPETARDAREGRWGAWQPDLWLGIDLQQATLGIVGLGLIGTATARRARAFGMNIVTATRTKNAVLEAELDATNLSLHELLKVSDFVSLHVPYSAETHHLINTQELAIMKPTAILINTARGGIINTTALQHALQTQQIRAAALDVTDPEPLPPTHPLYALSNCFIVPHIGSATERTRRHMAELACENLLAGVQGQSLHHCANP